jgi:hypothetical protein
MGLKVHNSPAAAGQKVDLRRHALAFVGGPSKARVFDVFAGRGMMHAEVWEPAAVYVGCDETWQPSDPGRRYVGDNRLVMRAVDLSGFNVFDFDAYGSPWEQMLILAARRRWKKGEMGALVVTDGSSLNLRFGSAPKAIGQLCDLSRRRFVPKISMGVSIQRTALVRWCQEARVTLQKMWRAEGNGSGKRTQPLMVYTAIGFEGTGARSS